ncbi:ubiquitin-conjugating enzyme e2 [Diplodia corticola]|uniref:Ubiquitin-conjugating enzyme e2 n=1 Tax=Diplodia corticola TaxID=236234 RepID=A0A1J9RY15_9PEZI|nr:ubiquitin-conjugating enzyme e2 [Diplodia corticola]OJD32357.1 ubiquitin-conjugating enzyme e2 [Diplodia corticola]
MATVATQRPTTLPRPSFKPIIQDAVAGKKTSGIEFNPSKHLGYKEPEQIWSMEDIGYSKDRGVSPIAVSQPFQLFTEEAVHEMRREIFKPEVLEHCKYSSNIAACQLRGYAPKYAPFTWDAWNHPDTLAAISKVAGVDLVPVMDTEVAHVNFSVKSEKETKEELAVINKQKEYYDADEGIAGCPWEDDKPVVGWHTDSYPFVCVLMLSDCTNMVGGETALRTGHGDVMKVRGPTMGCAAILQGRYITHQALRALGAQERITAVTSFRPRSPFARDDSVLTTVRPISNLSALYSEFAEYRLAMVEERVRAQLKEVREKSRASKKFATKDFKKFLAEQIAFLQHMQNEIVPDEEVRMGYIEEVDLPDCVVGADEAPSLKRTRVE